MSKVIFIFLEELQHLVRLYCLADPDLQLF